MGVIPIEEGHKTSIDPYRVNDVSKVSSNDVDLSNVPAVASIQKTQPLPVSKNEHHINLNDSDTPSESVFHIEKD